MTDYAIAISYLDVNCRPFRDNDFQLTELLVRSMNTQIRVCVAPSGVRVAQHLRKFEKRVRLLRTANSRKKFSKCVRILDGNDSDETQSMEKRETDAINRNQYGAYNAII